MNLPATIIDERVSYERLSTVELIGAYRIALFTSRRPRIFNAARRQREHGGPKAQVELALRTIDGSLTGRLSLGDADKRSQVTMTVTRMLKAAGLVEPVTGHSLVSIDGSCSVSSLRWISITEVPTLTRFVRAHDLNKPDTAQHINEILSTLGVLPVQFTPVAIASVVANDALIQGPP